ncbi:MAG: ATPase [Bacteroidia bacterium]|nr:ATPase [Bacteroidia bacterium]
MSRPLAFLCIASYFKGEEFLRACKACGCTVYLITGKKLEHQAWPRESIDEIFYVDDGEGTNWNMDHVIQGLAWMMRQRKIDRIVALDDFDVEKANHLREEFRIPGMGQTTGRFYRDKLAMRMQAADSGIRVPMFTSLFHDEGINAFLQQAPGPWVIKPRSEASATGIRKVHTADEFWSVVHSLGDNRHRYLAEQYKPGHVYHVDALSVNSRVVFARASQYLNPPMDVAHGGGVFQSVICDPKGKDSKALIRMNAAVMSAFNMKYSASHTEFIKCHEDGQFYFLETSSRVGGAHLAEMVEASSGINLWREWARLEVAVALGEPYVLPPVRDDFAGIIVSLARQQYPDTHDFRDAEIWWTLQREYHVGFIVKSPKQARILELMEQYFHRIREHYHASAPVPDKPSA